MTHDGEQLHREVLVVDLHTHGPGFVPQPFRSVWRAAAGAPPEDGFVEQPTAPRAAARTSGLGSPRIT